MPQTAHRRVVTGLDENGRSCVLYDGPVAPAGPNVGIAWRTAGVPADNSGPMPASDPAFTLDMMHQGGTLFMVMDSLPGTGSDELFWHATDTIDYIVMMKGEIVLVLETGEVTLRAGDVLTDRGVLHAWRNDSAETAVMGVVIIPAKPVGTGRTV